MDRDPSTTLPTDVRVSTHCAQAPPATHTDHSAEGSPGLFEPARSARTHPVMPLRRQSSTPLGLRLTNPPAQRTHHLDRPTPKLHPPSLDRLKHLATHAATPGRTGAPTDTLALPQVSQSRPDGDPRPTGNHQAVAAAGPPHGSPPTGATSRRLLRLVTSGDQADVSSSVRRSFAAGCPVRCRRRMFVEMTHAHTAPTAPLASAERTVVIAASAFG
jgi:hypothetical protein